MDAPVALGGPHRRLEKRLLNLVGRASVDYAMVEPGDRIAVALSGGKDSWVMLHLLRLVARRVPFPVSLVAVNLDQGQPGFQQDRLRTWLDAHGVEHALLSQDTYSVVLEKVPEGKTYCSLCSRLRRGILYSAARRLGATKLALGHHRDDLIETLMLNLLYSGQVKSMAPRLQADDGHNVVVRPLLYCAEEDIAELAAGLGFPILPCNLCGSQSNAQRQQVKRLLGTLSQANPNVKGNLFAALSNVVPSHLLDGAIQR